MLDPPVRSEQPPNSSSFSRFAATDILPLDPSPDRETGTQPWGRRRITMASISFFECVDSLYESDTVTRDKL